MNSNEFCDAIKALSDPWEELVHSDTLKPSTWKLRFVFNFVLSVLFHFSELSRTSYHNHRLLTMPNFPKSCNQEINQLPQSKFLENSFDASQFTLATPACSWNNYIKRICSICLLHKQTAHLNCNQLPLLNWFLLLVDTSIKSTLIWLPIDWG